MKAPLCSLLYVLSLAALSCSGSKPATPEAAPASTAAAPAETAAAAEPAPAPAESADAGGSSEQAEEELPKNCNYRVKGFCFAAEEDACAAQGCSAGRCMVLEETKPAKIKCR